MLTLASFHPSVPSAILKAQQNPKIQSHKLQRPRRKVSMSVQQKTESIRPLSPLENFRNGDPHVTHWHGQWTRWNPQNNEIITTFQSVRSFRFKDEEQSMVHQENSYFMEDGSIVKRPPFEYGLPQSKIDGIVHSAIPGMRAFFFPGGDGAYLSKVWSLGEGLQPGGGIELFFLLNERVRLSIGFLYSKNGSVIHVAAVREDGRDSVELPFVRSDSFWSESNSIVKVEEVKSPPFDNLDGIEYIIKYSEETGMNLIEKEGTWKGFRRSPVDRNEDNVDHIDKKDYLLLQLPDNITVVFPEKVESGTPFECTAYLLVGEGEMRQMSAKINSDMVLETMLSGHYKV